MKILLDTHILLWTLSNDVKLSAKAKNIIENEHNDIYYSLISVWEVEIKHLLHPENMQLNGKELTKYCKESGFHQLMIRDNHIFALEALKRKEGSPIHKDPFDRIILCQAIEEKMKFLTHDKLLSYYQVPNICMV